MNIFVKWFLAPVRKVRIKEKIIKRSKICLYNDKTGTLYNTKLKKNEGIIYCPCTGKKLKHIYNWYVVIYKTRTHSIYELVHIHRNGSITEKRWGKLKYTKDDKLYISF